MNEQEKRENVIKGLEICSSGEWNSTGGRDHTSCPYYPAGYTGCTCKLLMRDALALLKAQEPEAMDAPKPDSDIGCWYDITHNYTLEQIVSALKAQEPREPHYTRLQYMVNGMPVAVEHPECPRCFDNGLLLWNAEIERGAKFCKRCGQAVKWE